MKATFTAWNYLQVWKNEMNDESLSAEFVLPAIVVHCKYYLRAIVCFIPSENIQIIFFLTACHLLFKIKCLKVMLGKREQSFREVKQTCSGGSRLRKSPVCFDVLLPKYSTTPGQQWLPIKRPSAANFVRAKHPVYLALSLMHSSSSITNLRQLSTDIWCHMSVWCSRTFYIVVQTQSP